MQITAALVKELRERTGSGMMDCKKALQETEGDIEMAIENMRKSGMAKAAKKAGRIAAEGVILIQQGENNSAAMVEVNSETDFVAKDGNFLAFANSVAEAVLQHQPSDLDALLSINSDGQSIEEARQTLISKIGENINVRRFAAINCSGDYLGSYVHGGRIGVLVDISGGDVELSRDLAMHIAASRPACISENDLSQDLLDKEKAIFVSQAEESGKPAEIIEKMVSGKMQKFVKEVTLLGQGFIKDPDQSIEKLLSSKQASVNSFVCYEVGEGIEKKVENFAEEVMAQAQAAEK
ncbi:MAG: elongation factor Ts [Planctomycetota bacterium]|jgi:elongation factor Ts